jgi:glucosyl-dolichyl phosphate glucuronosyltransferase
VSSFQKIEGERAVYLTVREAMKIDVVIPTYNRAGSLRKTLRSLAAAVLPPNFEVEITVVNNNSTDATEAVFEEMKPAFADKKLEYLFEKKQGRSAALNAGIRRADGDLLTTVDDDIEVAENWFVEIEKIFRARWSEIDFVGGKMLPAWEDENVPAWIEPLKDGVISWRDYGDEEWIYTRETPMLTGGHAVFKRAVFAQIGLYAEGVGATGKNLMSCEDDILYDKLLSAGKRGIYAPRLVVYHFVPRYRVSKSYYRQWCFGAGMSLRSIDESYKRIEGARIFGVPRYLYGDLLKNLRGKIAAQLGRRETESLACENGILTFAGFFYARNLQNSVLNKPLTAIVRRFVKKAER